MLFHEALHLVFTTFSRQVLQQGRLTAYLADCAVFDTFDDRRTICLTIDRRYGARLYACLSHSPYKATFDAIVQECKQLHPNIDPQQVDYVFQSIRFAWGKIKSIRPPKPTVLFPIAKRPIARRASRMASARPMAKRPIARRANPTPYTAPSAPKQRHRRATPSIRRSPSTPYTLRPTPKLTPAQRQKRAARFVLYFLAVVFLFCSALMYQSDQTALGTIFLILAGTCFYIMYKYLK